MNWLEDTSLAAKVLGTGAPLLHFEVGVFFLLVKEPYV
jgi:hypothetical protein